MGERSRQAGAPSSGETRELQETVQQAAGWRPSVEMLACIRLITSMEPELDVTASARLAQRLVALRGSGLATDAADGLSEADYDVCVLAVEKHFLQSGYGQSHGQPLGEPYILVLVVWHPMVCEPQRRA